MSDLIDRQQAIDEIMSLIEEPDDDFNEGVRTSASVIYQLQSAQQEIIRCKDCYHYPGEYSDCPMIGWFRHEDDYCSRAERRTDE